LGDKPVGPGSSRNERLPSRGPICSVPEMRATSGVLVRVLGPEDGDVLANVAGGVFDQEVWPERSAEFLGDPRHHLAVAIEDGVVVGMASGVHYVRPDKAPELWINEVGVAPTHHRRGIGRQLLESLLDRARTLGCTEAWVLTDADNIAARALYTGAAGVESPALMYTFPLN
jgi:GNAT superfamily N-acetyltransferase